MEYRIVYTETFDYNKNVYLKLNDFGKEKLNILQDKKFTEDVHGFTKMNIISFFNVLSEYSLNEITLDGYIHQNRILTPNISEKELLTVDVESLIIYD